MVRGSFYGEGEGEGKASCYESGEEGKWKCEEYRKNVREG